MRVSVTITKKRHSMKTPSKRPTSTAPSTATESQANNPSLRPYAPPRVLSTEKLEAAAATCDGAGGFGKTIPTPCGTLGS